MGQLSEDRRWYWAGPGWRSVVSPDGKAWWNGSAWVSMRPPPRAWSMLHLLSARLARVSRRLRLRRWLVLGGAAGGLIGVALALATAVFLVGPFPMTLAGAALHRGALAERLWAGAIGVDVEAFLVCLVGCFAVPIGAGTGIALGAVCGL